MYGNHANDFENVNEQIYFHFAERSMFCLKNDLEKIIFKQNCMTVCM